MALPPESRTQTPNTSHATPERADQDRDPYRRHKGKYNRQLHRGDGLTVKGKKADPDQLDNAEIMLQLCDDENAPHDAVVALFMTGIAESSLRCVMNAGGSAYGGVFQGNVRGGVFKASETRRMGYYCLHGGKGFNAPGGLIGGVKEIGTNSDAAYDSLEHLIVVNQGNRSNFPSWQVAKDWAAGHGRYAVSPDHQSEAEAFIAGSGGGFGGGASYHREAFYFQIGSEENPRQSYWDGMLDLADEVRWRLFVDGRTIYFDDDYTLISQPIAAIIDRRDPSVMSWEATWDGVRRVATEMSIDLLCDPFAFRAGEVLKLKNFGPLSTGSTAKPDPLPGRWLIWEISRSSGSYVSTLTLRQPQSPRMEPSTQMVEDEESDLGRKGKGLKNIDGEMVARDIIDELILPIGRAHKLTCSDGSKLTSANLYANNQRHSKYTQDGNISDHYPGNPGVTWAVDMQDSGASAPTPRTIACCEELANKFAIPWRWPAGGLKNNTWKGIRFQLIHHNYPYHENHVHFGVNIDQSVRPPTYEQLRSQGRVG